MARSVLSVGRSLGAGVLALVVVSGCDASGDPEVTASPSVSSASPSASPSPSPSQSVSSSGPEVPAAAREHTDAGAEAFVKFYIEQSAKAWTIPDASLLEELGSEACGTCRNLRDTALSLERDKQRYATKPVQVNSAQRLSGNDERVVFELKLTELAVDVVDVTGRVVDHYPRNAITRAVAVVWREGRWFVDGISE